MTTEASGDRLARRGYAALLVLLLSAFGVQLFAPHTPRAGLVVGVLYTAILLGSLVAVSNSRRVVIVAAALVVPSLVLQVVPVGGQVSSRVVADLLACAVLLIVMGAILRAVFSHERIAVHSVLGAVSVFLLIGFAWSLLYQVADVVIGDAFIGLSPEVAIRESQLFYYSFVTLTTLGYGDIVPGRPETMALSTLEAIIGQLYLIVLVAYLVARLVTEHAGRSS